MAAYFIYARTAITDEEKSREYSRLVVPQIREWGGEIVAARGAVHVLEGDWQPYSVTLLKFDDLDSLMACTTRPSTRRSSKCGSKSNTGDIIVIEAP